MDRSLADQLRADLECESLLECFHGLTDLDRLVFRTLAGANEPLSIDEIADQVERERSTAYRSVQRLLEAGFIRKEQVNYDHGGYYHVYRPVDADRIADDLQRVLNDWYAQMGQLIAEFRETYAEHDATAAEVN
ncbi:MAG: helix-turn-helix domain-containing protein [Salinirussus sp.]